MPDTSLSGHAITRRRQPLQSCKVSFSNGASSAGGPTDLNRGWVSGIVEFGLSGEPSLASSYFDRIPAYPGERN